jgi:hypothetical protein
MTARRAESRQRIGLAALLAAFSAAALWLGWATAVTGLLDRMQAARAAADAARAAAEIARAEELATPPQFIPGLPARR